MSSATTIAMAIYIYQYAKVVLNSNYFFCMFTLFAFDTLQFIFIVNVLQSVLFYFYKIKWGGFLFKKENDNVCELKGGVQ